MRFCNTSSRSLMRFCNTSSHRAGAVWQNRIALCGEVLQRVGLDTIVDKFLQSPGCWTALSALNLFTWLQVAQNYLHSTVHHRTSQPVSCVSPPAEKWTVEDENMTCWVDWKIKRGAQLMTGEKWTIEDENMTCWVDQKIQRGAQLMTEEKWQIVSWNVKSWLREHTYS